MSYVTLDSTPINFQNYTADPAAPYNGSGFANSLALYKKGAGGPNRILLNEAWGWSVYDNSNPMAPIRLTSRSVLVPFRDHTTGSDSGFYSLSSGGDGQSATQGFCVSPDGQRLGAYMGGAPVDGWGEIFADALGENFKLEKAVNMAANYGQVMQQINGRYIVYSASEGLYATDVTNLPSSGVVLPDNSFELNTNIPVNGGPPIIRGNFLVCGGNSGIGVVNISSPGPIGSITTDMASLVISSTTLGLIAGQQILAFVASIDPVDSSKLWLLISVLGSSNAVIYYLVSVTSNLIVTVIGTPWSIPNPTRNSQNAPISNSLTINNGILYVMIWDQGLATGSYSNSSDNSLYSTSVDQWVNINTTVPPNKFQMSANLSGFGLGQHPSCLSVGSNIYMYLPCGPSAYVIPLACVVSGGSLLAPPPLLTSLSTTFYVNPLYGSSIEALAFYPAVYTGIGMTLYDHNFAATSSMGTDTLRASVSPAGANGYDLQRALFAFNTASLGADATITSVSLVIYGTCYFGFSELYRDYLSHDGAALDIYQSNVNDSFYPRTDASSGPSIPAGLLTAWTSSIGSKLGSSPFTAWPTDPVSGPTIPSNTGPVTISLPTSSVNKTGLTKFCARINLDASQTVPTAANLLRLAASMNNPTPHVLGIQLVVNYTTTGTSGYSGYSGSGYSGSLIPGPVLNFRAIAEDKKITLLWSVVSSVGIYPIETYKIRDNLGNITLVSASNTSQVFTGLTNGTTYTFSIVAINAVGSSLVPSTIFATPSSVPDIIVSVPYNYQSFYDAPVDLRIPLDPLNPVARPFLYPGDDESYSYLVPIPDTDPVQYYDHREYPVRNHIPTPEFDAVNEKALVEAKPWSIVSNYDASSSDFIFDKASGYTIDLKDTNLRRNGVAMQFFDENNRPVVLKDYLGDGRLLYRLKTVTQQGAPILFSFPPDAISNIDPSDGVSSFGKINYTTGIITNLIFPVFSTSTGDLYHTFKPAMILGKNISWPVYVREDVPLMLKVNEVAKQFVIPKNETVNDNYQAGDIVDILNKDSYFISSGLSAGVTKGQIFIRNIGLNENIGPTFTLALDENDTLSCNTLLFGFSSEKFLASKVYFTYSYTLNTQNPYMYVWYSTPHLVLRRATGPSELSKIQKDYILNKLKFILPANVVLDEEDFPLV